MAKIDKLEGVLQTQQHLLQQLANHLPPGPGQVNQQTSPTGQPHHVPQAEAALFLQTPSMYSATSPSNARFNNAASHMSTEASQQQQQQQHQHQHRQSMHIPAPPSSSDIYAATNPPLESPSLNITGAPNSAFPAQNASISSESSKAPGRLDRNLLWLLSMLT